MFKRISALAAGITLVAMATVVPAWAQTSDTATTNVEVDSFLEFAIQNPGNADTTPDTGDECDDAAYGDCPFGSGASQTVLANQSGYASAFSAEDTILRLRTNNTAGAQVTAYGDNGGVNGSNCLVAGTDVITDSIADLTASQAANDSSNPVVDTETGLAFRLLDTGTATALRGTDEDTQWGTGDTNGTNALWAASPILVGNARVIYDTDAEQTSDVLAVITYFAGVANTQPAGNYTCTANYTASTL